MAAKQITPDKLADLKSLIEKLDVSLKVAGHRSLIEIDTRFHELVYEAAQNPILKEILENFHGRCARLWNSALSAMIPIETILDQLKRIYTAFIRAFIQVSL